MKKSGGQKKGALSPEDRALWAKVTKTMTPLHPDRTDISDTNDPDAAEAKPPLAIRPSPARTQTAIRTPAQNGSPPQHLPLHRLEDRYRRRIARGLQPIDARIDLHGLTQRQAHERLRTFLYSAQSKGHKLVLVITGKGVQRSYDSYGMEIRNEQGVLRRLVPQWLSMPEMRHIVVGYEEAHTTHGGSGALYVRIRRRR